jgi:hypothetical protein
MTSFDAGAEAGVDEPGAPVVTLAAGVEEAGDEAPGAADWLGAVPVVDTPEASVVDVADVDAAAPDDELLVRPTSFDRPNSTAMLTRASASTR